MMNSLYQLSSFLQRVTSNVHLRASHISLYAVLCKGWIDNGCKSPFRITRSKVMKLARINSKATYHRVIRELTSHGYILYSPSYHPVKGSEVSLIGNDVLL
jgi:hypothetical protein